MIYFLVPIYSSLGFASNLLVENFSKKIKFYMYIISYIPIIFLLLYIAGLRDINIGADTSNYRDIFNNSAESIEIGYRVVSEFMKYLGGSYNLFLFLFFAKTICFQKSFFIPFTFYLYLFEFLVSSI